MAKAAVYYFSGTGNSLVLAKLVAQRLDGDLIPIVSVIDREKIEPAADVVGIVFPVYYADLPNIVRRFAEKLETTEGKYIFAISNYGGGAGDSLKTLDRILRSRGKALSAGFGVHMPQNAFHKPWEIKKLASPTGRPRRGSTSSSDPSEHGARGSSTRTFSFRP
jgi:flavodoxin